MADWYRSSPLDDFAACPDEHVQFFDTELDTAKFGWKSLKREDWLGLAHWLQCVGLISVDMELLWRPTDRFSLRRSRELEILFADGDGTTT